MPAELDRDPNSCRLCNAPLHAYEMDLRLCAVCEEYAQQLGVRNTAQLDDIVTELLNDPVYLRATRPVL